MMTNSWSTYLGLLRDLHTVRSDAHEQGETAQEVLRDRGEQLESFAQRIREQENRIVDMSYDIGKPVRFVSVDETDLAPPRAWDEAVSDLNEYLHLADRAIGDTEYYGLRPPLLPDWSVWARNGAIYTLLSLPNMFFNAFMWLVYVDNPMVMDDFADEKFTTAAWGCCFWPVAAVVTGIVLIRSLGVPRMKPKPKNEWDRPRETPLQLSVPLGFTIALGTAALSVFLLWLVGSLFPG